MHLNTLEFTNVCIYTTNLKKKKKKRMELFLKSSLEVTVYATFLGSFSVNVFEEMFNIRYVKKIDKTFDVCIRRRHFVVPATKSSFAGQPTGFTDYWERG